MRKCFAATVLAVAVTGLYGVTAARAGGHGCNPACGSACGPTCAPACAPVEAVCVKEVCKKVCVPVPDKKKKTHNCYSCKCEDVCYPRCCSFHCHSCNDCCNDCQPCVKCGCPHTRHILLKKIVTEECPTTKCVVQTVVDYVPCKCRPSCCQVTTPCCHAATPCTAAVPVVRVVEPPTNSKK